MGLLGREEADFHKEHPSKTNDREASARSYRSSPGDSRESLRDFGSSPADVGF